MPAPNELKKVAEVSRPEIVFRLARVPGSARAHFAGSDGVVRAIDFDQPKAEPNIIGTHGGYVTGLVVAGPHLVSAGYDGRLVWWDAAKRSQVREAAAHPKWIRNLAASADGRFVASVADDMVCRVWDASSAEAVQELRGHAEKTPHHYTSMLYAVAFAPDGRHLATGDKTGVIHIWETDTGKQVARLHAPIMYTWDPSERRHSIGGVRSLAFSPDGNMLAVGGMGKVGNIDHLEGPPRVEVFDWRAGKRTLELSIGGYKGLVERVLFAPGGGWLVAVGGGNDGFAFCHDVAANKPGVQEKLGAHAHDGALSEDGKRLFVAGHGKLGVYDLGVSDPVTAGQSSLRSPR